MISIILTLFIVPFLFLIPIILNICKLKNLNVSPKWYAACFLAPLVYIAIFILAIYRLLFFIVLKIRYGSKFDGFLKGLDSIRMARRPSDRIMNYVLVFKSSRNLLSRELYEIMRELVGKMQRYKKFNSKFYKSLGYYYIKSGELTIDDCITEMEIQKDVNNELTVEILTEVFNDYFNAPLPKGNSVPWEIVVGNLNINTKDWNKRVNESYRYYPILFRCEQAFSDDLSILQVIRYLWVSEDGSNEAERERRLRAEIQPYEEIRVSGNRGCLNRCCESLKKLLRKIDTFYLIPAFFILNYVLKGNDQNVWGDRMLCEDKFFVLNLDHSGFISRNIWNIQREYPGFTYLNVFWSILSGCVSNYIRKISPENRTRYITAILPHITEYFKLINDNRSLNDLIAANFKHTTSEEPPYIAELPMYIQSEARQTILHETLSGFNQRLHRVYTKTNFTQNIIEHEMTSTFNDVIGSNFPQFMLESMSEALKCTININIVKGATIPHKLDPITEISDVIAFSPPLHGAGFAFTITSYNGMSHIGMSVRTSLMRRNADVDYWLSADIKQYVGCLIKALCEVDGEEDEHYF